MVFFEYSFNSTYCTYCTFFQLFFAKNVRCVTVSYVHCIPLHTYIVWRVSDTLYGESLIRCMESLSYVVWRSVRTLHVAHHTHVCFKWREKRAIGRLRPKSDKIINRNSCFEAVVFDSVWKSYFWGSVPGDAGIRFSRGSQERLEAEKV